MEDSGPGQRRLGLAGRVAKAFLRSKLTPLIVVASIVLGLAAVALTPREEEPQIIVPMVDVIVGYPGATPAEVEAQLTTPVERRLWGLTGVEYLYSTSIPNAAMFTVRFKVNEPLEASLVKVRQELRAHPELPPGAMQPVVRLLSIDDVPFLALTLHGLAARRRAAQLADEVARELAASARNVADGGASRTCESCPTGRMRPRACRRRDSSRPFAAPTCMPAGEVDGTSGGGGGRRPARRRRARRTVVATGGRPIHLVTSPGSSTVPPEPTVRLIATRGGGPGRP